MKDLVLKFNTEYLVWILLWEWKQTSTLTDFIVILLYLKKEFSDSYNAIKTNKFIRIQ